MDILCNNGTIEVIRFINKPVSSNAYLLIGNRSKNCIVIDPGSKEQTELKDYIVNEGFCLQFIILTHEHFDHCWGTNYLKSFFPNALVVSTIKTAKWVAQELNYFNKLYYNDETTYSIRNVDYLVEDHDMSLTLDDYPIRFLEAKGHTDKGMCVYFENYLFTGDTMIKDTKPVLKKRYGASKTELRQTIDTIFSKFPEKTIVFPGHGDCFLLYEMKQFYISYFEKHG